MMVKELEHDPEKRIKLVATTVATRPMMVLPAHARKDALLEDLHLHMVGMIRVKLLLLKSINEYVENGVCWKSSGQRFHLKWY
jgi:hypothetical protein